LEKYSKIEKTRKCSGQMSNSEFIKEGKANGKAEVFIFFCLIFNLGLLFLVISRKEGPLFKG